MTVKEFLKDYYGSNPMHQMVLCNKLKKELAQGAKIHAGWAFFVHLIDNTWYNQNTTLAIENALYHPDNISQLCNTMFKTNSIEKVLSFLDAFEINGIKSENLLDLLLHRIHVNLSDFPLIDFNTIVSLIHQKCDLEPDTQLRRMDSEYHVIPEMHLRPSLNVCPYDNKKYVKDSFDCEDFARNTKSWYADQGIGNITLFFAIIHCYDELPDKSLEFSFAHGVCLLIIETDPKIYHVKYLEPQYDTLWNAGEKMPWGWGEKIVKLAHILI